MNRFMILAAALLVVVAGMSVSQEANAGLFNRNDCCKPQKCRQGLISKLKAKRAAKDCCEPAPCCAPEPTCCEAAPVCAAPAPVYSAPVFEAAPACGCAAAPAPSCGCEVAAAPSCGCEAAAPACGCETASCDCLSRRKLRRANRKGECCGAVAKTCNTCDAGVQTVSYDAPVAVEGCSTCGGGVIVESAPAVEGCSTCGGGETIVETAAPLAPAAEEAAPEAPEAK